MNTTAISEWLNNQSNLNTVNIVQQAVSLFFGVLILIKSYDFSALFASVRKRREETRRTKEMKKLEKFRKLLEMAKTNQSIDISVMLDEKTTDNESSEEKKPESIMRTTRKKRRAVESV
jgi:hypothetical protein